MDLYLSADHGRSSFAVWIDDRAKEVLLEAIYVIECVAPGHLNTDRFLPPTPLRILINHQGGDLTQKIDLNEYHSQLRNVPINRLLSNRTFTQTVLPRMRDTSGRVAAEHARPVVAQAVAAARETFDREIRRLQSLPDDPLLAAEVQRLQDERDRVVQLLGAARLRLDAIRLIRRGPPAENKPAAEEPEEE
jgi:ATP-dependent helicase HepA